MLTAEERSQILEEHRERIEQLKKQVSRLENAVAFLRMTAEDVQAAARRGSSRPPIRRCAP